MKTSVLIIFFIIAIVFSSCRKNGSGSNNSIIGTWQLNSVSTTGSFFGNSLQPSDSIYPKGALIITFSNNGSFTASSNTQTPIATENGVYYITNDSLYDRPIGISIYESEGKLDISNDSMSLVSTDAALDDTLITTELFLRNY